MLDLLFVAKHKLIGLLTENSFAVMSYDINHGTITTTVMYVLQRLWEGKVVSAKVWQNSEEIFVASTTGQLLVVQNKFTGDALGQ